MSTRELMRRLKVADRRAIEKRDRIDLEQKNRQKNEADANTKRMHIRSGCARTAQVRSSFGLSAEGAEDSESERRGRLCEADGVSAVLSVRRDGESLCGAGAAKAEEDLRFEGELCSASTKRWLVASSSTPLVATGEVRCGTATAEGRGAADAGLVSGGSDGSCGGSEVRAAAELEARAEAEADTVAVGEEVEEAAEAEAEGKAEGAEELRAECEADAEAGEAEAEAEADGKAEAKLKERGGAVCGGAASPLLALPGSASAPFVS
jgi:hypothetical protein